MWFTPHSNKRLLHFSTKKKKEDLLHTKRKVLSKQFVLQGPISMCAGASGIRSGILANSLPEHPPKIWPWSNYPVAWFESKQELRIVTVYMYF